MWRIGIGHRGRLHRRGEPLYLILDDTTIPWASCLYVKKEHAPVLGIPFTKLTELAADLSARRGRPVRLPLK